MSYICCKNCNEGKDCYFYPKKKNKKMEDSMRPELYSILTDGISKGIEHGMNMHRGYKHSDTPSEHHLKTMIEREIWHAILIQLKKREQ